MTEFLEKWGALIVAIIAIIQVWIIALWKRFFKPGKAEIYKTGTIEVGYSYFGATIGLHGTLRALDRDLFVSSIYLKLINQEDDSKHKFEWGVFRSPTITLGRPEEMQMEIPGGFLLRTSEPYRYNIQFHDVDLQQKIRPVLEKIKEAWMEAGEEAGVLQFFDDYTDPIERQNKLQKAAQEIYPKFAKGNEHLKAFTKLKELCYWKTCQYKLIMVVNSTKPTRSFEETWFFSLSPEDEQSLKLNPLAIIDQWLRQGYYTLNFRYVKYED